ncbi:MAG: cytochrome d ubiquinol oxidase subunit 2 [Acidithiobacillales bacterium SM1_46]|nr:MAG: cytochrome d ubiquinol oxidase subunit 2 [Acidithiobacillales bacterium SM1_46]
MIFDYDTLKFIWWLFVGVLLIGFALTDGFDLGVAALLRYAARNDDERRVVINSIGPVWEGNQVWFVTAGGALFAAWPLVYAAAFSGFYFALLLVLLALILRPVGFDFRSKVPDPRWRGFWDWGLFVSGAVPALVFGVTFGNLLQGVPFHYDDTLRPFYTGSFWQLLNPFALLAGVVSLAMLVMHGGMYLQLRTEGAIAARAARAARVSALVLIGAFAAAGLWVAGGIDGYRIVSMPDPNAVVPPLAKAIERAGGAWLANFRAHPSMWLAPAAGFAGALLAVWLSARNRPGPGIVASAVSVAGVILTAGLAMFPFIMPSSSEPGASLTMWDATSSPLTLSIMFWVVVLFLPIVIGYTTWAYRKMRGKVTVKDIREQGGSVY